MTNKTKNGGWNHTLRPAFTSVSASAGCGYIFFFVHEKSLFEEESHASFTG
jgi:hypothetical protein